jgi:sodium/bile acid cotransporter 7
MRNFLARRWFLLLLALGVALALARPGWLRPLGERLPLRGMVALSLFLVAWSLEGRRLWAALRRPAPALWALAVSYGALPALALLAGPLLPLADLRVGLLIIASVPCTIATAVLWTRLAGGNEALALLVVVLTNALSCLLTTAWLAGASGVAAAPDPRALSAGLLFVLVVPVALGQCSRALPGVAAAVARHRALNGVLASLLVLAIVLKGVVGVAGHLDRLTPGLLAATFGLCLGTHLSGVALGLAGGWVLGLPREDRAAVAFAGSQKTLQVGLFLVGAYYADYPLAALPLLLYHGGQLVADTFIADALRDRRPAEGGPGIPI